MYTPPQPQNGAVEKGMSWAPSWESREDNPRWPQFPGNRGLLDERFTYTYWWGPGASMSQDPIRSILITPVEPGVIWDAAYRRGFVGLMGEAG